MAVEITVQVPETLGQQLQLWQGRWPEILERGLRELMAAPGAMASGPPTSASDALRRLRASREALLATVAGVDEKSLYRLRAADGVECSVRGVLEHIAHHDREHTEQVRVILAGA